MTTPVSAERQHASLGTGRTAPRAVADTHEGVLLATADIAASPEAIFRALTTDEMETWWGADGQYHSSGWKAEVSPRGQWSVNVNWANGLVVLASGEFIELDAPRKIVHTRNFDPADPALGPRETTVTYHIDPIEGGCRVTVRDAGFAGRSEACLFNAQHWAVVLGWLDAYVGARGA